MKQHPVYTVSYFIDKFEKIPEGLWTTMHFHRNGKCCALGHTGRRDGYYRSDEQDAFIAIFKEAEKGPIVTINDYCTEQYPQPTPKQRILAALYDIRAMIEPRAVAYNRIGSAPSELTKIDVGDRIDVMREKVI